MQQIFNGIAMGSIYDLVAVGFVLIYKATDVINFAQGDIMMFGAFVAFIFANVLHVPFLVAILLTLVIMALFAKLLERVVLRPLVGESVLSMLMVTVGLGIIIRSVAGMISNYQLAQVENVRKFCLIDIELSADDPELTATMKLKRKYVNEKFSDLIASMY